MRAAILLAAAVVVEAQTPAHQVRRNTVAFDSPAGAVELEWLTPSTFRLQRCRQAPCPTRGGLKDGVSFTVTEQPGALDLRTRFLHVRLDRLTGTSTVRNRAGRTVMTEVNPGALHFQAAAVDGERFYGLGPRSREKLDLRGETMETARPLLISSAGYGIFFAVPVSYRFDLAQSAQDRVKVTAPFARRMEYFFYYGPSSKDVLEEHLLVTGAISPVAAGQVEIGPAARMPRHATEAPKLPFAEVVSWLMHASMSAVLTPAVDLQGLNHPAALFFPLLTHPAPPPAAIAARNRWGPYLFTYLDEASTRGLPMLRPMAMQYGDDADQTDNRSAFMLGDELLIPVAEQVSLPRGLWTNLCTNEQHAGRRTIEVSNPGACPLAHNGSIVPVDAGSRIELHYFPRLGAEFFLSEEGDTQVTQAHAGPAGEYLRLEIESRVAREYEWVVHHVTPVERMECTGCASAPAERYDEAKGNYHTRVRARAGSDVILNLSLREPL